MKNIYLVGKAGSGKTMAALYLMETYGYKQSKFAFPVYNLAYDYFNMQDKDRELLQVIGTDAGRQLVDNDIWVRRFIEDMMIVKETLRILNKDKVFFVSDDCRFPNEHKVLKDMGWIGVYLDVPDEVRIERLYGRDGDAKIECLNHKSETGVDLFKDDLIKIDANCSIEVMNNNLKTVLEELW